jgi:hypothetical protein
MLGHISAQKIRYRDNPLQQVVSVDNRQAAKSMINKELAGIGGGGVTVYGIDVGGHNRVDRHSFE